VQERWRRVFQCATVTGGAWAHAPPPVLETGGSALSSPSLPFCNGDLQNQTKTQHRQSILVVFFFVLFLKSVLGFFPFFFKSVPFLCLLCRSVAFFFFRWQIRRG
jgi:hypothetical protein